MTPDEIVAYAEKVKQQNRDRVKKDYNNTIKTDPDTINFGSNNVGKQTTGNTIKG